MLPEQEAQVRGLYHICHPGCGIQPPFWYFAHPTLVMCIGDEVVGFTSFTVTVVPGFGPTLYGMDVCIHPDHRGRGLADSLHKARLAVGFSVGARTFIGVTKDENMAAILEKSGMHPCIHTEEDEMLFVGPIVEV